MRNRSSALLVVVALAVCLMGTLGPGEAPATAADGFDAGNIIDDELFYDPSAMTAAEIQSFLDGKIGRCSSDDCINVLRASVSSRPARVSDTTGNIVCEAFTGGTNLRVSEIIYRAQVACGISAKVILVTLQKEQGLVTSKDPSDWNLNYAMGQACPDTAPCDPAYRGIGVQILSGTTQLKTYKAARFARQPGTHNIQYSPTSSCGTKRISVRNYATAALYNYTPYTPNDAALKNLYGVGDSCSSYGNRNFWRDYRDWFGSTRSNVVASIDTVPHLLALETSGRLWAYPSNGKSGWLPRVTLGDGFTEARRLLTPGDLDGDGRRDVITVDQSGSAYLHRGTGALGYEDKIRLTADWAEVRLATATEDFSGDGVPDVFTTASNGDLLLWRGTGGTSLRQPITVGTGWSVMDLIVGAGDFSGDGYADVVARNEDGDLFLYRGNGKSGWLGSKKIGNGWHVMSTIAVAGDVTGDGRPDLLATDSAGALWLYPAGQGGTLSTRAKVGSGWKPFALVAGAGSEATGLRPFPAGMGDVNGDAASDLVAVTRSGQLRLYPGDGAGRFGKMSVIEDGLSADARYLSLGDFDGDGVADLGVIDPDGLFWLRAGTGDGRFASPVRIGNDWGVMDRVLGGIDFDGDRRVDVIARDADGLLHLYRGNGAGGWINPPTVIGNGWSVMSSIFTAGDFDGDRLPDIIARRTDGDLMIYPTDGVGGLKSPRKIGQEWDVMSRVFSPGDFNGDGSSDVIGERSDGRLVLYRGNGKGGWSGNAVIGEGWQIVLWVG